MNMLTPSPFQQSLWRLGMLCVLLFVPAAFAADNAAQRIRADGLLVDWGVISAESVEGNPEINYEVVGSIKDKYHLVVAVFDANTGQRITNAQISAKVRHFGKLRPEEKALHTLRVNGADMSYGNYFEMPPSRTNTITLAILGPGAPQPVTVKFKYKPK